MMALIAAWPVSGLPMHTIVLLFPLLILGAARPTGPAVRILDVAVLRFLGEIIYSLSIFHMLLYILFVNTLQLANGWGFRTYALYLTTLLMVSTLATSYSNSPSEEALIGTLPISHNNVKRLIRNITIYIKK